MTLSLTLGSLASRATRTAVTGGAGIRRIAVNGVQTIESEEGLTSVWNGLARIGGSIVTNILIPLRSTFQIFITQIFAMVVSAGLFIFNFNWNATDAQLDEQIKQSEIALAASRGALKGSTLGFSICGILPAAALAVFNEPLGLYVLKNVGEEAADEIASNAANLIRLTLNQAVKKAFIGIYKNYRSILRPAALGVASLLVRTGFFNQASIDKANKKRNEPWSFATAHDETIESIKDPIEQAEAEEYWEELGDACIEAGYVIAGSLDSYFTQQKLANDATFGSEKTVEILLNRDADETLVVN